MQLYLCNAPFFKLTQIVLKSRSPDLVYIMIILRHDDVTWWFEKGQRSRGEGRGGYYIGGCGLCCLNAWLVVVTTDWLMSEMSDSAAVACQCRSETDKDTNEGELMEVTFRPKLTLFEDDIMRVMGIKEDRKWPKFYYYWLPCCCDVLHCGALSSNPLIHCVCVCVHTLVLWKLKSPVNIQYYYSPEKNDVLTVSEDCV